MTGQAEEMETMRSKRVGTRTYIIDFELIELARLEMAEIELAETKWSRIQPVSLNR